MKSLPKVLCQSVLVIIVLYSTIIPAHAQIPPDDLTKIEAALPAKATATPQRPRKLLVFTLAEGYKHASIPYAAKALELMGQKTGAFAATISDDMASFTESNLKPFDAVCFVSTTELKFADAKLRESLMKFVKGGKGVIGIHAASDNFYNWPEAAEMMGGLFDGHPWTANGTWAVKIDDAEHPLAAAFKGEGFAITDEIYRFKGPISRERLRVLVSLDLGDERNMKVEGLRTSDIDIPVSWLRNFGKGRVFYCSLGHNNAVYWNAAVLQHYLDGIQFALGDLQADATPSVATCLTAVTKYEYGQSRARLTELDNFIRFARSSPEALSRLEKNFLQILSSPNATLAGKQYVCENLSTMGASASVPVLAKMLNNAETVEMARFALERIPHEAALEALRNALPQAAGKTTQAGLITSLGHRRDAKSVPLLVGLMKSSDAMIAHAAVAALGEIANAEAADALRQAKQNASGELLSRILAAQLQCAEAFAARGDKPRAVQIYIESNVSSNPGPIRFAAVRGQIKTEPENAAGRILQFLKSDDPVLQAAAPRLVGEIPLSQNLDAIVSALPTLSALQQVQLLAALSQRRETSVRTAASQATKSAHAEVRLAALQALAFVGDTSSVRLLAEAATQRNEEGKTARESLYRLRGEDVDAAIVTRVPSAAPKLKVELLHSIEARRIFTAVPVALQAAHDDDESVRIAAFQSLKTVAGPEHLNTLIAFLLQTKSEEERSELEKTVAAVAQRISEPEQRNAAIVAAMPRATKLEAKASLLHVLGKIGESSALPTLRGSLQDSKPEIRVAAIRAFSDWPNDAPREDLLNVAQASRNQTEKILALRGFVRLVGLDSSRAIAQTLQLYQTAMQLAPDIDTKRAVLSGLASQKELAALEMAAKYFGDANLNAEAVAAVVKIAETTSRTAPSATRMIFEKALDAAYNEPLREQAKKVFEEIARYEDFITAWMVSGPYTAKEVSLFEHAFAPEKPSDASTSWSKLQFEIDPDEPWLVPLDKILGGDNRVAYLRAMLWSDKAQPARLELGSNDGVKAWLNGELVHGNNVNRGVTPGEDRVAIALKEGENVLLLKIIQNSGRWGACARVRGSAGEHLEGVRVMVD